MLNAGFQACLPKPFTPAKYVAQPVDRAVLEMILSKSVVFENGIYSVNLLPTLLVSINCDAISATLGDYPTIDVRHF
jgi:hypothetical protein